VKKQPRKLLVAAVGVAAVNYACGAGRSDPTNAPVPTAEATNVPEHNLRTGNLMAVPEPTQAPLPPQSEDAGVPDARAHLRPTGNLMPPRTK
jgi:hypothetical protein